MRRVIHLGIALLALVLVAACSAGPTPTPVVIEKVVEKPVEKVVTQVVEKQVTQVVEKEKVVEKQVTQVVEKEKVVEKVVTATPFKGKKDEIVVSIMADPGSMFEHPWFQLAREYNTAHPEVDVLVVGGVDWATQATMALAGNPADLAHGSMGGLFSRFPEFTGVLDVSKWLSKDLIADMEPGISYLRHPTDPNKIMGWPTEMRVQWSFCANPTVFEKAGLDWKKIQTSGWNWDEFIAAMQKITTDKNGKHPNEAGFDEKNVATWGYGWPGRGLWDNNFINNGVPPFVGMGSRLEWTDLQTLATEGLQFTYDWMYKYKIQSVADLETDELGNLRQMGMLAQGKMGAILDWGNQCARVIPSYNNAVATGKLAGTALPDAKLVVLPWTFNSREMKNELYLTRDIHLSQYEHKPRKADSHYENVAKFMLWFLDPAQQMRQCSLGVGPAWEAGSCPIPAAKSVRDKMYTPERNAEIKYIMDRSWKTVRSLGHPAGSDVYNLAFYPALDAFYAGKLNAQQTVAQMTTKGNEVLDKWVKNATAKEKTLVELWCKIPDANKTEYAALWPKWKPVVSDACLAKMKELGIQ